VVDSIAHNFRTIVAVDCVGDRAIGPHSANLFDMGQKYADLMDSTEVIGAFEKSGASAVRGAS
jgi:maleamate amidohydrolase